MKWELVLEGETFRSGSILSAAGEKQRANVDSTVTNETTRSVVLNLCYSDVFELQLPEIPASTVGGEGFWELQSKTPE